jgi:Tol biopolymer transport system component
MSCFPLVQSRPVYGLFVVGVLLLGLSTGCSSSTPPTATSSSASETAPAPTPAVQMLYATSGGTLELYDARRDTAHRLMDGSRAVGPYAVSPSGRFLALGYTTPDSSHLALVNLSDRTLQRVEARAGSVTYSLAWHPKADRLAYGYYRPAERKTRGPGGIRIATADGDTRSVGCTTAREVLHWLPNGTLATRTDDALYVVGTEDCATRATQDARRMHQIRYAPRGTRRAYIHRELRYDRAAEDYVPDSSLVLSGPQGQAPDTLFRDARHPRHPQWSPEATELALDVAPDDNGPRQVVVYDGSRPTFLVPPAQTSVDHVHPRWSPSGTHVAFTQRLAGGAQAAVRVKGQTRRLGPVDNAVWGWLGERSVVVPGPDSIRVRTLQGQTRIAHPAPKTLLHIWRAPLSSAASAPTTPGSP